jgi:uncharacterized lipoprotein YmbA
MIRARLTVSFLLVLLLGACGSGPPPRLYLLESVPPLADVNDGPAVAGRLTSLGMSPVDLPGYARDTRIASLSSDGTVTQSDAHRWAEDPAAAISRVLAERLRSHAGTTVLIEPWPRDYAPVARVEVVFDRLLREPLGGADMAGRILLLSGDGRTLLEALPFQFVHYGRDTDKRVFFAAVSQGIDDIARMAVRALQELKLKS